MLTPRGPTQFPLAAKGRMSCGAGLHVCIDFPSNTNIKVKDVTVRVLQREGFPFLHLKFVAVELVLGRTANV